MLPDSLYHPRTAHNEKSAKPETPRAKYAGDDHEKQECNSRKKAQNTQKKERDHQTHLALLHAFFVRFAAIKDLFRPSTILHG